MTINLRQQISTICCLFFIGIQSLQAQLNVNTAITPQQLVEDFLIGGGVTVSNVTIAPGSDFRQYAYFTNNGSSLELNSGIFLSTGYAGEFSTPINTSGDFTSIDPFQDPDCFGGVCSPGDSDLNLILGDSITFDAAVLEFDFVPETDTIRFRYVFASEEYNEFVCSEFNDIFAFLLTGPGYTNYNIARVPNTSFPVAINTINNGQPGNSGAVGNCTFPNGSLNFSNLFIDNNNGPHIEYDGMTVALEAVAVVQACSTYHIKLAIADVTDAAFDSGVFLEAGSFSALGVDAYSVTSNNDSIIAEGCANGTVTFSLVNPLNDDYVVNYNLSGTVINGVDIVQIPDSVIIPAGETSVTIDIIALEDSVIEGSEPLTIVFSSSLCYEEYDSITILIGEEIILPAPTNLACESLWNSEIIFTWDPVPDATGYEVSLDSGITWIPASPGPLVHQVTNLYPGEPVDLFVRAIGGTVGCSDNLYDSLLCSSCPLDIALDSVQHLACYESSGGAIYITAFDGILPYTYSWDNGSITEDLSNLIAGTYGLTVEDATLCKAKADIEILDPIEPTVDAYIFEVGRTDYSIALNDAVTIGAVNVNPLYSYQWTEVNANPNAGIIDPNSAVTFAEPDDYGFYTYKVTAFTDTDGRICADTALVTLEVTGFLGIPDAFTPNGDLLNDRFRPVHLASVEIESFKIFNRWGQLLYSTGDVLDGGWDGTYKGKPQARDMYLYVIRFKQVGSNEERVQRGEFMLIR
ncbi:MAG: choice-of-anchor L domain-containing protein [Saprospiraceae bacterium]|nr:choice-of-anchor L domain-containing protein [Saprospiraceae bacterium]